MADEPLALTACFLRAVSRPDEEVRTGWVPVGGGGEHKGPVTRAGGGGAGSRNDVSCGLGDELCGEPAWGAAPPFQELSVGREGVCIGASQHRTPGREEAGGQGGWEPLGGDRGAQEPVRGRA